MLAPASALLLFFLSPPRHSIKLVMDHQKPFSRIKIIISRRARREASDKNLIESNGHATASELLDSDDFTFLVNYHESV
jgi:hypothetical protein